MKGYHDIGGEPAGEIPKQEHEMLLWEKRVEAMLLLLSQKGVMRVDENRRGLESVGAEVYHGAGYAQRRIQSISTNLIAKGLISIEELAAKVADIERRHRRSETICHQGDVAFPTLAAGHALDEAVVVSVVARAASTLLSDNGGACKLALALPPASHRRLCRGMSGFEEFRKKRWAQLRPAQHRGGGPKTRRKQGGVDWNASIWQCGEDSRPPMPMSSNIAIE
jgi:hypothetical protein